MNELVKSFLEGWYKGISSFPAAWRLALRGAIICVTAFIAAFCLELAGWPMWAAVAAILGAVPGVVFVIGAWLAMFRAAGFLGRKST